MSKQTEMNLDQPVHPGAAPEIGFGDLIRYAPILEELISGVEQAIAGGSQTIPAIKFEVAGRHIVLGPTPLSVS